MRTEERTALPANGLAEAGVADELPATLFSRAPVAELVTDPEGVIRHATPGAAALLRVEPGFLRGAPLRALVLHPDLPRLAGLLHGDPVNDGAALRLAVPGGHHVSAEMTVTAARDDRGFVTGLRWRMHERGRGRAGDESERAKSLRRRLERLISHGHGVCLIDAAGTVTWANRRALVILGRPAGDVVGATWADLAPERGAGPVALAFRRGREGSGTFARFARGDGTSVALDYAVAPLVEDDGVVGAALAFTAVGV